MPVEDQVVSIDGLKHVSSACMENVCQTFLEFELDVDVDIAATDVREKLDLIRADFPQDVEDPKILKFDINATVSGGQGTPACGQIAQIGEESDAAAS